MPENYGKHGGNKLSLVVAAKLSFLNFYIRIRQQHSHKIYFENHTIIIIFKVRLTFTQRNYKDGDIKGKSRLE